MIYKINEIYDNVKGKKISLKKIKDFFSLGLELGIFKVSGNEGGEIIYENHDNKSSTSNQVLLNEQKKEEPKPVQQQMNQDGPRPAQVGNKITSGFGNPFAGTSWGN